MTYTHAVMKIFCQTKGPMWRERGWEWLIGMGIGVG